MVILMKLYPITQIALKRYLSSVSLRVPLEIPPVLESLQKHLKL